MTVSLMRVVANAPDWF